MSESKVQGKNAILTIYNVDGYYPVYCVQSVEITIQTEQLPATNINGGGWRGNKPGKTGWSVDLNGVLYVRNSTDKNWTAADFVTEQIRKNGIDIKLVFTNENGNYEQFTGHANPETTGLNGTVGQLGKFNLKLIGDGELERNAIIPPSTSSDVERYEYIAFGGETFFSDPILISKTILDVQREAVPTLAIITAGTPDAKQAKYTSASGRIDFDSGSPLSADEIVIVLYK